MLEVRDDSPKRRTFVLWSRTLGYCGLLWLPIGCGGLFSLATFIAWIFPLLNGRHDWAMLLTTIGSAGVSTLLWGYTRTLPVEEKTFVLEPGRASVVKELLNRPDYEVLKRTERSLELGPDSGVSLSNFDDDSDPTGIEIWGPHGTLNVARLSKDEAQQLFDEVERWIERRFKRDRALLVQQAEAATDDSHKVEFTSQTLSDWCSIEFTDSEPRSMLIRLQPGGPEVPRFKLIIYLPVVFVIGGCVMLYYTGEWFFWIWTGFSGFIGIAAITHYVRESCSAISVEVTEAAATMTRTLFGWTTRKTLLLNEHIAVGFVRRGGDNDGVVPTVTIRSGIKGIEFGFFLSREDKQELVRLLRDFLKVDHGRNVFIRVECESA